MNTVDFKKYYTKELFVSIAIHEFSEEYMSTLLGVNIREFKRNQIKEKLEEKYDSMTDRDWQEFYNENEKSTEKYVECMKKNNPKFYAELKKVLK